MQIFGGLHVQTGRQITMVVQPNSSIPYVRMQAGTVAEFSVVHATVGLAQARSNYIEPSDACDC